MRLFVRATRQIRLTDEGGIYFEQSRPALAQLVDAERQISGQHGTPAGRLRIRLPTPYAHYRVLPVLPAFRAASRGGRSGSALSGATWALPMTPSTSPCAAGRPATPR